VRYLKYLVTIMAAIAISSSANSAEVRMAKADWDTRLFSS